MKKDIDTSGGATTGDTPQAPNPGSVVEQPAEVTDKGAKEGEPQFEDHHEVPAKGGCYVRQTDGTLKSEG